MSKETKLCEYYADLYPGWQNNGYLPSIMALPPLTKLDGTHRVRVLIEFPTLPPSVDGTVLAEAKPA